MSYRDRVSLETLVGETLTHIDSDDGNQIMLTTESGRIIKIFHEQDCCEYVTIEDTEGNWHDLIGKVLVEAGEGGSDNEVPPEGWADSWTRTELTFRVNDATVISKWIGESNGYYSESVDIEELSSRTE